MRSCSKPNCRNYAVATLTYDYKESTAVLGPLSTECEPHAYDLCAQHAKSLTVPRGWEVIKLNAHYEESSHDEKDILALVDAVREGERVVEDVSTSQKWSGITVGRGDKGETYHRCNSLECDSAGADHVLHMLSGGVTKGATAADINYTDRTSSSTRVSEANQTSLHSITDAKNFKVINPNFRIASTRTEGIIDLDELDPQPQADLESEDKINVKGKRLMPLGPFTKDDISVEEIGDEVEFDEMAGKISTSADYNLYNNTSPEYPIA